MTQKQIKYLSIFSDLCRDGNLADETSVTKHFKRLIELDYALAAEAWEYFATTAEGELAKNKNAASVVGNSVCALFYAKASGKCAKLIGECSAIRRAVYSYNPKAGTDCSFSILIDELMASRTDNAEEILKCVLKNPAVTYGKFMEGVQDRLFIEVLKKNPTKKIELGKKVAALMLTYIAKIRTSERAMLEQRIRETM